MSVHKIKKGLELPVCGQPRQAIEPGRDVRRHADDALRSHGKVVQAHLGRRDPCVEILPELYVESRSRRSDRYQRGFTWVVIGPLC